MDLNRMVVIHPSLIQGMKDLQCGEMCFRSLDPLRDLLVIAVNKRVIFAPLKLAIFARLKPYVGFIH